MASGPLHARDFLKRQDLIGSLTSGIFGENNTIPGLGNGVSGGLLPGFSTPAAISLTSSSASSTASISSLVPSTTPTSSSPSPSTMLALTTSSASTPPGSTASAPITSAPTPVSTATPDDNTLTITSTSTLASSSAVSPAASATITPKSFFQNKPLEGGVFAAIGIVAAIIIVTMATMALRKSRRNRFDRQYADAVTFDPVEITPHNSDVEKASDDPIVRYMSTGRRSGIDHPPGLSAGHGGGDYPVPPLPVKPERASLQTYYGQQQGIAFGNSGARPPPRGLFSLSHGPFEPASPISPNPIFDPATSTFHARPGLAKLHIPTPNGAPSENAPTPLSLSAKPSSPPKRYLMNSVSPVTPSDESSTAKASSDSHSRNLDPMLGRVPVAPPLPPSFGNSRQDSVDDMRYTLPRGLKIANE